MARAAATMGLTVVRIAAATAWAASSVAEDLVVEVGDWLMFWVQEV